MGSTAAEDGAENARLAKASNGHRPSPLAGMPIGPGVPHDDPDPVILRYMYEGDHLGHGRLCHVHPAAATTPTPTEAAVVSAAEVMRALREDGVDVDLFYACAYESRRSSGGWMPLEPAPRHRNPWNGDGAAADGGSSLAFAIPPDDDDAAASRRIDVKLVRRPRAPSRTDAVQSLDQVLESPAPAVEHPSEALRAIAKSVPGGKISCRDGYFGIGILSPKTPGNVGTLWRSAYQLGASVLYTIGGRYKPNSADTLNVPARLPLIELDDWAAFAKGAAPKAAVWVAVETGGTPLADFVHPRNAVYLLGSEDHGLPTSVVRGCREVVTIESAAYGSYNVAVAGSIVMYDRLVKMRRAEGGEIA